MADQALVPNPNSHISNSTSGSAPDADQPKSTTSSAAASLSTLASKRKTLHSSMDSPGIPDHTERWLKVRVVEATSSSSDSVQLGSKQRTLESGRNSPDTPNHTERGPNVRIVEATPSVTLARKQRTLDSSTDPADQPKSTTNPATASLSTLASKRKTLHSSMDAEAPDHAERSSKVRVVEAPSTALKTTKYREESRWYEEELKREKANAARREADILRLARNEIEDRERRRLEAEHELSITREQAENDRRQMIKEKKHRELLEMTVERLPTNSPTPMMVIQSQQQPAAPAQRSDEQAVEEILMHQETDHDCEASAQPITTSIVADEQTEVRDIVADDENERHDEQGEYPRQEKGKGRLVEVADIGCDQERHQANDHDDDDGDGEEENCETEARGKQAFVVVKDIGCDQHQANVDDADDEDNDGDNDDEENDDDEIVYRRTFANFIPFDDQVMNDEGMNEDMDDEMGDDTDSETDEEMGEGAEERSKEMNAETIPKPIKFARPKGGQGPPLKACFATSNARAGPSKSSTTHGDRDLSVQDMFRVMMDGMTELRDRMNSNGVSGLSRDKNSNDTPRGRFRKGHNSQPHSKDRLIWLRRVRRVMNDCMGIKHDADINREAETPVRAIIAFNQGVGPKPVLKPMQIDWSAGSTSRWNQSLFKDFLLHFLQQVKDETPRINVSVGEIEGMFHNRIERLRRQRKKQLLRDGESNEQGDSRLWTDRLATLKRQRSKTRKGQASCDVVDPTWDFLFMVVDSLGREGMSSDESEVDQDNKKGFRVMRRPWRSKKVENWLRLVDRDRNTTNAYGNDRAGCRARTRQRPGHHDSAGDAVPGLPECFYHPLWLQKLPDWDRADLQVGEDIEIPEFE